MELALYLKIELIRVGGGRAHSEIWLFVLCQTVPLSLRRILQRAHHMGNEGLGEPDPEFLRNCGLLGW